MAAPVVTPIGTVANSASGSTLTVTADVAAGLLIVVGISVTAGSTVTSVTDSAGNTYVLGNEQSAASRPTCSVWYSDNSLALTNAVSTITVAISAGTFSMIAAKATNLATYGVYDGAVQTTTNSASTNSINVTTPTLSSAVEAVFGFTAFSGGTVASVVQSSGFTSLGTVNNATLGLMGAYSATAATTAINYTPSWTNSRAVMLNFVGFSQPTLLGGSTGGENMLLGVG